MRCRLTVRWQRLALPMGLVAMLSARTTDAATITWKGHTWNLTNGGMAGVCQGNPANISVDASGYLHMKVTNNGGTWTGAEIFSTDKIGFGTYQWQIEGAIDKLDKNVVVGLFPYGPEAGLGQSGNNEIDIEFAHWGNDAWPNGNYTVWPPTGSATGEYTFTLSLAGGTALTTRFSWSSTKIDFATLGGFVAVDASTGLLDSWTFAPANPTTRITQEAMPLGMNLWCFENPPADGKNVEIIVRDFQFVPLGDFTDGGAGASDGSRDGAAETDAVARGTGGTAATGGTGNGGTVGTGGVATGGAVGRGGAAAGGATGSRSAATGGSPGSGGQATGGARGSGGATGTGGAGTGGSGTGGAGQGGAGGTTTSAGSTGSDGTGGATGTGGPAKAASKGCSCRVAGARTSPCWPMLSLAAALLPANQRHRRRQR